MPNGICSAEGCQAEGRITRGLCDKHYMRWLRHGMVDAKRGWNSKAHLHSKHPLYKAWQAMILRCHDPKNTSYARYGGLGIRVCKRWRDNFQHFLSDMGERPNGLTLDRIDPCGNYEPSNCRWADIKTQRANISAFGDQKMRKAMSEGVKAMWRRWRLERGLPEDEPYKERRKRLKLP